MSRDSSILTFAYKTYIRPLVEYGTAVFSPRKCKFIDKLENVQNSFTRKLLTRKVGFVYDRIPSARDRNTSLGLSTLALRRRKFDLLLFHKIAHGMCGLRPNTFCTFESSNTRGGASKLRIPRAKTACRMHFFTNRAAAAYATLSRSHSIPDSVSSFKSLLKKYLKL